MLCIMEGHVKVMGVSFSFFVIIKNQSYKITGFILIFSYMYTIYSNSIHFLYRPLEPFSYCQPFSFSKSSPYKLSFDERKHAISAFLRAWLISLEVQSSFVSCFPVNDISFFFYDQVVFCCVCIPQFPDPPICCRADRLIL